MDKNNKDMSDMFKHKIVRDRFDKKKGVKDRKEAMARRIGDSSHECNMCSKTSKHTHFK